MKFTVVAVFVAFCLAFGVVSVSAGEPSDKIAAICYKQLQGNLAIRFLQSSATHHARNNL